MLTALNPGVQFKFYEVCKHVVVPDFGLALDKEVISIAAWNALSPEHQDILQTSFNDLEETDYYLVGLASKPKDLEAWASANGPDALLELDASGLAAQMEPVNERLATEAFGEGAWKLIQDTQA